MFNMFIMRRDLLDAYCTFLFDVLAELEKRIDPAGMDAFQARFPGRVSELLLDTEKVNWWKKGTGFLRAKFFGKKYEKSF